MMVELLGELHYFGFLLSNQLCESESVVYQMF
jgi:hypothetical protein